jgi:RNA polymerase sigma-70 factor, ECF subfamily
MPISDVGGMLSMADHAHSSAFSASQPSDAQFEEVVEKAQAGDKEAFIFLIRYFEGQICGYLKKGIGNYEAAEDLFADTICRAWKALPTTDERLRSVHKMKSWLFTIATNLLRDYLKYRRRLETVSIEHLEESYRAGRVDVVKDWKTIENAHTEAAEDTACENERIISEQNRIEEALRQVSPQLRKSFYMKDVQELSHGEIAQALGITESCARAYASRGRKQFLKALADLGTKRVL